MTIEIRYQRKSQPGATGDGKLHGRAIPYNSWTTIGDPKKWGFREKINPSAAKKSVNDGDIVLLDNHDTRLPLARKSAGTLVLRNGGSALDWDAIPADTTYAQDVVKNVRAKNYGGCSFGFEVVRDKWTDAEGNPADPSTGTHREILEMKLHEVSICTFPAYGDTSVSSRVQVRDARGFDPSERGRAAGTTDTTDKQEPSNERAAAATYSDLSTCGDCGATGQYGAYCTNCGEPMSTAKPGGDFCSSCGSPLDDDSRAAHVCETRDDSGPDSDSSKKPYGDVTYADPGYQKDKKKRYPLDTKDHAKAAWSYINMAKNAAKYTAQQLASIKAKIKSALSKFGVSTDDADESKMAEWEALCDFREMTPGVGSVEFDGDEFGVLPDNFVRTADANDLARDISDAYTAQMRMTCIERAVDLNLAEMIPEHWGPAGQVGANKNAEVVRDMDAIYTIALEQAPTPEMLEILNRAQPYLSNETREAATRQLEEEAAEEERSLLPRRTLKDARAQLDELQRHRRTLDK